MSAHITASPRTAERLLEALGAECGFRDAVLGDLAEEFALRAAHDGVGTARRWYYREALRVAPYLLRDWARRQRAPDVAHLAGVVLTSYVFLVMLLLFVVVTANGVMAALGIPLPQRLLWNSPLVLAVALTLGAVVATTGGYIAASLGVRAPLVSAVTLGVVWSCVILVVTAIVGSPVTPYWYRLGVVIVVVVGTTLGGMRRVCTARPESYAREDC